MDYQQLKPIGKTCASTGAALVPGQTCYSVVLEHDGKLTRLDYSEASWQGPPEGAVGYWKALVPNAEQKARPLDPDALLRYFEQLCEEGNPVQQKFAWVLSLLLVQKRRLQIDSTRQDGEIEYVKLVGTRGEGPFEVREQDLSEEEIEALQRELNSQFASEAA